MSSVKSNHQVQTAAKEPCLATIRELARAYQAFAAYAEKHVRQLNLTPSQFDVIATLGNTSGMSMGELAEKTLVTKGTLTGIIDRLEKKGLVRREVPQDNRRSFTIVLTQAGEETFTNVFPAHVAYLKERFDNLDEQELAESVRVLTRLRQLF